jgi:membrane fusion protein (multidrug efflux system)
VTVVTLKAEELRPFSTFTGRVQATAKIDLRARIEGFLERRLFEEGAEVKEGDLLFVIEKGLYQAAVDEAKGATEKAEAALRIADISVDRETKLVKGNAVAQQKLDEAIAEQGKARGELDVQRAALEKAKLQLSYTEIRSPLRGRIGRSVFAVGNFVGPASEPLATIVSQDPIYVSFPVTQREILAIRKMQGVESAVDAVIHLELADGSRYDHPGKLNFVDVSAHQGTDSLLVRASLPNPDRILIDGQLVTVIAESGKAESVLLVQQQALQVDQAGIFVLVVDSSNKIEVRRVETGPAPAGRVAVRKGLAAGERVVTEGIQKVRPGQIVQSAEAGPGP